MLAYKGKILPCRYFMLAAIFCWSGGQLVSVASVDPMIVDETELLSKCVQEINGISTQKNIGDTWTNSSEPCLTYKCEMTPDNTTHIRSTKESCDVLCNNEYDLIATDGKCCGHCVQTKCKFQNQIYEIGKSWKSADKCIMYDCSVIAGRPEVSSYAKTCPEMARCLPQNVYTEDCCEYCRKPGRKVKVIGAINSTDVVREDDFMSAETYLTHPCIRECKENDKPMTCSYTFMVEWYQTLSKACYDCPTVEEDCFRPHCIPGDGVRRSVLVVNRMMPGPSIQVCEGDTIVVDVKNELMDEGTSIHWHGLHMKENPYMDGVPHISQCAISPKNTFRYEFTADNPGTHFWHSHIGMQRGDGAFGSLIIKVPRAVDRNSKLYDFDLPSKHTILLQDWAHIQGVSMFSAHHHSIGDNKPPNILINGIGKYFEMHRKSAPVTSVPVSSNTPATTERVAPSTTEEISTEEITTELTEDATTILDVDLAETPPTTTDITNPSTIPPDVGFMHDTTDPNLKMKIDEANIAVLSAPVHREKRSELFSEESINIPYHVFEVAEGNRYRFRLINAEFLNCPMELSIDDHNVTMIASDGYDIEPLEVESFVSYAGERFDFIVDASQNVGNYWIRLKGLMDCGPQFTRAFQVAILRYAGADITHPPGTPSYDFVRNGLQLNALNKGSGLTDTLTIAEVSSSHPEDPRYQKDVPDFKFYIYYDFYKKDNPHFHVPGLYGFNNVSQQHGRVLTPQLNHISMKMPPVPLMPQRDLLDDSMFCNSSTLINDGINCEEEFCECSHVLQVPLGALVEMVLVDEGFAYDANHPFHLHGYAFRVVGMNRLSNQISIDDLKRMDEAGELPRNLVNAPIKDTVTIPDGGYTIIRFTADNPGYWLFHCHIEFHAEIGMSLVIKVGEHSDMKPIPKNFPTCSDYFPSGFVEGHSTTIYTRSSLLLCGLITILALILYK